MKCYGSAKYGFCLLFIENTDVVGGIVDVPCHSELYSVHCDWEQWVLKLENSGFGFCAFVKLGHLFFFFTDSQADPTYSGYLFSVAFYVVLYNAL